MTHERKLRGALLGLVLLWTGVALWFVEVGLWHVGAVPLTVAIMFATMARET